MTKQQANWSPYDNNGGTCVAIAGADYCVIAADTRLSTGYSILTRDYSKISKLADKSVMASSGFQADVRALQKLLSARHSRFYRHLEMKSKHPDAAVPPLDETLKKITEPDPELLTETKSVIDEFRRRFELKENPKLKKSTRQTLREKPSGSREEGVDSDAQAVKSIEYKSSVKVEKIGDLTPIQDFEAMITRRDNPEWVNRAIQDMKNKIFDLVENSFEGDTYQKAVECLVALRKSCIVEQEPKQFNNFLRHLCRFCLEKDLKSFREFLASNEITLISKTEAVDSEVTEDEARSFMVKTEQGL